jgi:uncharacterized protein YpbB
MKYNLENITPIILNTINNQKFGKLKLALFLKGSRSKTIQKDSNQFGFGGLLWYDIPTIENFILQLENMEIICKKQIFSQLYNYEIYTLTEVGKKVLKEKINIKLQIIKKETIINIGETEKETLKLWNEKNNMDEIAKKRNLTLSTIYTHLSKLINQKYIKVEDVIDKEKIIKIKEIINKEKLFSLKEIKNRLPNYSYDEIKCVLLDEKGG